MSSTNTLRLFIESMSGIDAAVDAARAALRDELLQLEYIQYSYDANARNARDRAMQSAGAIVVVKDVEDYNSKVLTPARCVQSEDATFVIPIVTDTRAGSQCVGISDTVTVAVGKASVSTLTIQINEFFDSVTLALTEKTYVKSIQSSGWRHSGQVSVWASKNPPPSNFKLGAVLFNSAFMPAATEIVAWLYVNVSHKSPLQGDFYPSRCVPFFHLKLAKQTTTRRGQSRDEMGNAELTHVTGSNAIQVCSVGVFFDTGAGNPLTPIIAGQIARIFRDSGRFTITSSDVDEIQLGPFVTRRNSRTSYCGVVFAALPRGPIARLLEGVSGCGDASTSNAIVGEEIDPTEQANGRLYFPFDCHPHAIRNAVNACLAAVAKSGHSTFSALDKCNELFDFMSIEQARRKVSTVLRIAETEVDMLYFYSFLVREFQAPVLSNLAQLKEVRIAQAPTDEMDEWEIEAGASNQALEYMYPELVKRLEKEEQSAPNTATVDDVVTAVKLDGVSEMFAIADRQFSYDRLTSDMVTSMFLTRANTECMAINYTCDSTLAGEVWLQVLDRIEKLCPTHGNVMYGAKTTTYPCETTKPKKSKRDPEGKSVRESGSKQNTSAHARTYSFYPDSGDLARIYAIFHTYSTTIPGSAVEIQVFFAPKSIRPPEESPLNSLKYIVGKDPRCTPSWVPVYADAVKIAAEARLQSMVLHNRAETHGIKRRFLNVADVGGRTDAIDFHDRVKRCCETGNFNSFTTVADINAAYAFVEGVNKALLPLLAQRKIDVLIHEFRNLESKIVEQTQISKKFYGLEKLGTQLTPEEAKQYSDASKFIRYCYTSVIALVSTRKHVDRLNYITTSGEFFKVFAHGALYNMFLEYQRTANAKELNSRKTQPVAGATIAGIDRINLLLRRHRIVDDAPRDWSLESSQIDALRYAKLCGSISDGAIITVADHLWALAYERTNNNTDTTFRTMAANARRQQKHVAATQQRIRAAFGELYGNICDAWAGQIGTYINKILAVGFIEPSRRVDCVVQLLASIRHWVTSPCFSACLFSQTTGVWATDPAISGTDAFQVWCKTNSVQCSTVLGEIDWMRTGAPLKAVETVMVFIAESIHSRSASFTVQGAGACDIESGWNPLKGVLNTDQQSEYDNVCSSGLSVSDAVFESIVKTALSKGASHISPDFLKILIRNHLIVFAPRFVKTVTDGVTKSLKELEKDYATKMSELDTRLNTITTRLVELETDMESYRAKQTVAWTALNGAKEELQAAREQADITPEALAAKTTQLESITRAYNVARTSFKDSLVIVERARAEKKAVLSDISNANVLYLHEKEMHSSGLEDTTSDVYVRTYLSNWQAANDKASLLKVSETASAICAYLNKSSVNVVAMIMLLTGHNILCAPRIPDAFADDASVVSSSELGIGSAPEHTQPAAQLDDGTRIVRIPPRQPNVVARYVMNNESIVRRLWAPVAI